MRGTRVRVAVAAENPPEEAFVFDQADRVTKSIYGVIPYPDYSAFGWVR